MLFSHFPNALKPLKNKWNIAELDGVRVLAIVTIVFGHLGQFFGSPPYKQYLHLADVSVDVLLILSGLLIGIILFRSVDRKDHFYFIRFYLRRAMRLLPVYYVVLFFMAFYVRGGPDFGNIYFWHELLFFTNYPHHGHPGPYLMSWSWYLSVEEHFYICIPFIILLFARLFPNAGVIPYVALVVSGYVTTIIVLFFFMNTWDDESFNDYLFQPTHSRLFFLFSGVLAAYLSHYKSDRVEAFFRNRRITKICSMLPLILYGLWLLLATCIGTEAPAAGPIITLVLWPLSAFTWTIYMLLLMHADFPFRRFFRARVFEYLSPIAYAIFLTHLMVVKLLVRPYAQRTLLFAADHSALYSWSVCIAMTFVPTLIVSYFLHIQVEKPIRLLRERMSLTRAETATKVA